MDIQALLRSFGLTAGQNDWWIRIGLYESPWVWGFWLFWAFSIGACMGSFLNVCVLRIPRGESIAGQSSHCFGCGNLIRWYDNIPVVSYLVLRGRCRKCSMHIPARYFLMEVLTGLLFAGAVAKTGWLREDPAVLLPEMTLISLAITTFQIDWKCRLIPDVTTVPAMVVGLVSAALLPGSFGSKVWYGGLQFSLTGFAVMGIALALFALIGHKIARQEVFGWGDVKYMMAAGALAGLTGAVFILTFGALLGMLFGIYVGITRYRRGRSWRKVRIPLGPGLAAASLLWVFAGSWTVRLYLDWLLSR